jgi:glutamine synthetase
VGPAIHRLRLRLQQPHPNAPHPSAGRIGDRTVDGSCNPYLAATALLASGLDGIEKQLDPGEPTSDLNLRELTEAEHSSELLPGNPLDATRELERDDTSRAAFGTAAREDYINYFAGVKRREFQEAHQQITQWELDRNLQLY